MSIIIKAGDLLRENTDAIVNTVNCVGVMGKGIALQFKQQWPQNYKAYYNACKAGEVKLGKMFVYELGQLANKPYYIINFPTKNHWKDKSTLTDIKNGLEDLTRCMDKYCIKSVAIPPLGCGNGGLKWDDVKNLIETYLAPLSTDVEINLYEPCAWKMRF